MYGSGQPYVQTVTVTQIYNQMCVLALAAPHYTSILTPNSTAPPYTHKNTRTC